MGCFYRPDPGNLRTFYWIPCAFENWKPCSLQLMCVAATLRPNFYNFKEPKNRFPRNQFRQAVYSLVGRYENHIPNRFLSLIDCLQIPALIYQVEEQTKLFKNYLAFSFIEITFSFCLAGICKQFLKLLFAEEGKSYEKRFKAKGRSGLEKIRKSGKLFIIALADCSTFLLTFTPWIFSMYVFLENLGKFWSPCSVRCARKPCLIVCWHAIWRCRLARCHIRSVRHRSPPEKSSDSEILHRVWFRVETSHLVMCYSMNRDCSPC